MSSAIAGYYLGFFLGKGMVMHRVQNWTLNKRAFNSFHDNIMLFAVGHGSFHSFGYWQMSFIKVRAKMSTRAFCVFQRRIPGGT